LHKEVTVVSGTCDLAIICQKVKLPKYRDFHKTKKLTFWTKMVTVAKLKLKLKEHIMMSKFWSKIRAAGTKMEEGKKILLSEFCLELHKEVTIVRLKIDLGVLRQH
ncbi:hypothetical protein ACJX0J_007574, partial [Zea mays]